MMLQVSREHGQEVKGLGVQGGFGLGLKEELEVFCGE